MGFPGLFPALPILPEGNLDFSLSSSKAWEHVPSLTCLPKLHLLKYNLTLDLKDYYRVFLTIYFYT